MKTKFTFAAFQQNKKWHLLLLFLLPLIIYVQCIGFDYTNFDDNGIILQKFDVVKNIHKIDTAFKVDAFFNKTGDFYRPIQNVSFMLDAQVSGPKLWMFHITNLLIHLLTVVSLYFFLQFLGVKRFTSFLMALLFGVHPLFASGVAWVPSRGDILIGLFGILLFMSFGLYLKTKNVLYLIGHLLLFLITIFTKETTVLFPLFFLFYYFFILHYDQPILLFYKEGRWKKILRDLWPFLIFWAAIFIFFYILRKQVVANTGANADVLGVIPFFKNNQVIPTVIGKFFIPINLSTFPLYDNTTTIIGLLLLLLLAYLTFEFKKEKRWIVFMGLMWFLLFIIPPTVYRLLNADVFFNYLEHRTYLPMIGVVIILAFVLDEKIKSALVAKRVLVVYTPIIFLLAILAWMHCADYKNNETLSARAAKMDNPSGLAWRAVNRIEKGDTLNGLSDINKALELDPQNANIIYRRGILKAKLQDHEGAEKDFSLALTLAPNSPEVYMARSVERRVLKKYDAAFRDIYTAMQYDTLNPKVYTSFGNLYIAVKNYPEAIASYTKAIKIFPNYAEAYNNRAYAKILSNDFGGAVADCDSALKKNSKSPIVYNNLGQAYRELNQLDSAFKNFNKAIALKKDFGQAYFEKAKAWQKMNATSSACDDWKRAVQYGFAEAQDSVKKYCR